LTSFAGIPTLAKRLVVQRPALPGVPVPLPVGLSLATSASLSLRSLAIGALPMVRSLIARSSCRRYAASSLVVKAPIACGGCGALGWLLVVMSLSLRVGCDCLPSLTRTSTNVTPYYALTRLV
jgi:hypothetical protein